MNIVNCIKKIMCVTLLQGKRCFNRRNMIYVGVLTVPLTTANMGIYVFVDNVQNIAQSPTVLNDTVIDLSEKIHVEFAQRIADPQIYERSVAIMPQEQLLFTWDETHQSVDIAPKTLWDPDTIYSLALPYHNAQSSDDGLSYIFSFTTGQYPHIIAESAPSHDRYMKKGDEMTLTFDRSLETYDILAISRPSVQLEQHMGAEDNIVQLRITDDKSDAVHNEHHVTIFARYRGYPSAAYFPIGSTSFNTFIAAPDVWPREFDERLDIARRSTVPKITTGKYIDVNLDAEITTLFQDGDFVVNFVNSSGAKDTPTPTGTFHIYNKNPYALSEMFQVYLPYWMAFTEDGKYGFHDLIVWPEGHEDKPEGGKESTASIGNAVSPGCVRHDAKESAFLYEWADIGTPVIIY